MHHLLLVILDVYTIKLVFYLYYHITLQDSYLMSSNISQVKIRLSCWPNIPDISTWSSLNISAMIKLNSLSKLRVSFISEVLFLYGKLNVGSLPAFLNHSFRSGVLPLVLPRKKKWNSQGWRQLLQLPFSKSFKINAQCERP